MITERLTKLFKFTEVDPNDPFNWYAIAMEYLSIEEYNKAREYFEKVLNEHKDYLPVYYQAAQLYMDLNEDEKADEVFKKGIELAKNQKNALTERELRSAYDEFLFE